MAPVTRRNPQQPSVEARVNEATQRQNVSGSDMDNQIDMNDDPVIDKSCSFRTSVSLWKQNSATIFPY